MPQHPAQHLDDQHVDTQHLDVLIVGAGLSGIGAACHLQREHPQRSYAILESRDAIGGTWDLFRYPGVRSDSDMFTLGYSFSPWTESKAIADGDSILEYVRRTAREFGVEDRIRYHHRVVSASWSSVDARWTVTAERTDARGKARTVELTCSFLYVCSGYYRYDEGYTPEFAGLDDYTGRVVHPQHWPQDLDYAGKRVVVIGSGATAVTLVPAMAEQAAQVTMVQRSPTYVVSLPSRDVVAQALGRVLPAGTASRAARWKNIRVSLYSYQLSRSAPALMRTVFRRGVRRQLPKGYDVATHFTPQYNPWDERLCVVPDGDLFRAIGSGRAQVVTDHVDRFTAKGIRLRSGAELEADVVVTATGLNLLAFGGIELTVDGTPVRLNETVAYKGMMLSGIPNFAFTVGYTNASWTLKADLVAEYVCRLLRFLDENGYQVATPVEPPSPVREPLIGLRSGYVQRSLGAFPSQGPTAPWRVYQNYPRDVQLMRRGPLEDAGIRFGTAGHGAGELSDAPRSLTVRGRHVRYRVTGPADAPHVLLLHGVTRSLEDWNEQHELLSDQYRVISVDLPGFGHSQRLREPVSLTGLARFVEDFLDAIGVTGPVDVAGNSLGGAVAMQLAVQAPERVRSLLLANSAGFGREVTPTLRILGIRPRAAARAMLRPNRAVALQAERSIFHDPSFATPERVDLAHRLSARPEGADAMLDTLGALGGLGGVHAAWRAELLPAVAALAHPTFVVWGDHDRILPAKHLLAARAALPHAKWHLFPATGHMPQIERAEEFSELAREFWSAQVTEAAAAQMPHQAGERPEAPASESV